MNTFKIFLNFLFVLFASCCEKNIEDNSNDFFNETEAPVVEKCSIENGDVIQPGEGIIEIHFSENMILISSDKISMNSLSINIDLKDNVLKIKYPQLLYSSDYELVIASGALKGKESGRYLSDYSLKFKTKDVELVDLKGKELWEIMKYGLFVHYVYGEEYGLMTPMSINGGEPKDINEFTDEFDVEKFADDVAAMGFEYVIFTAWHANMNLLYPSPVMTKWRGPEHTSKRDLLDNLYDALIKRGIYLALYTHIWVGNDFHPEGEGFFNYANKNGIITDDQINTGYVESVYGDSKKWNQFVREIYDEMSSRYGEKIFAYWYDGTWTGAVDKKMIMETINKYNPTTAHISNGALDHGLPYGSKEVGHDVVYDFKNDGFTIVKEDVNTWTAYDRNIAIIQGGNWWASTNGSPQHSAEHVYKYTVLQAGTTNNGGVSWALSPFVDNGWEKNVMETMKKAYGYLKPVEKAIKKTKFSTAYPTEEGTSINTLEYGFVATMSLDEKVHYIHVLRHPESNELILPKAKDNSNFKKASMLVSGEIVKIEKNNDGYKLTLPNGVEWDNLNTVIKLEK